MGQANDLYRNSLDDSASAVCAGVVLGAFTARAGNYERFEVLWRPAVDYIPAC
jgi:hypothetical protein